MYKAVVCLCQRLCVSWCSHQTCGLESYISSFIYDKQIMATCSSYDRTVLFIILHKIIAKNIEAELTEILNEISTFLHRLDNSDVAVAGVMQHTHPQVSNNSGSCDQD